MSRQNFSRYTVTYRDLGGGILSAPIAARSDVEAVAIAASTCEALRAVAVAGVGRDRVDAARAYVALQIFADEREGKVVWSNPCFSLRRT
jgi:hypothetical protein